MTITQFKNGENTILNPTGKQLMGTAKMGLENGLNPKELMEAAIGLCVSLTITHLMQRDERLGETDALEVQVTSFKDEGGENRIGRFEVEVKLPGSIDAEYGEKLLTMAERGCTIGNTVRKGAVIETKRV